MNQNSALKTVVAVYSTDNADAVADHNVEAWQEENIVNWRESPNQTQYVNVATVLMWTRLCLAVRNGEINNLKLQMDGKEYDCVSDKGKVIGDKTPENYAFLERHLDMLYQLL